MGQDGASAVPFTFPFSHDRWLLATPTDTHQRARSRWCSRPGLTPPAQHHRERRQRRTGISTMVVQIPGGRAAEDVTPGSGGHQAAAENSQ